MSDRKLLEIVNRAAQQRVVCIDLVMALRRCLNSPITSNEEVDAGLTALRVNIQALERLKEEASALKDRVKRGERQPIAVSLDRRGVMRCSCGCASECPMGRTGMDDRCTQEELVEAGYKTTQHVSGNVPDRAEEDHVAVSRSAEDMKRQVDQAYEAIHFTPSLWCKIFDVQIMDPDGWRRDGKSFDDHVSCEEFKARCDGSTTMGFRRYNHH
jgi:hypothetical protein